jgi:hypothetical protein
MCGRYTLYRRQDHDQIHSITSSARASKEGGSVIFIAFAVFIQRQVLYLGEINDSQREAWCRVIDTFDEGSQRSEQLALFSADRTVPEHAKPYAVQVRLDAMQLHRPRQWGPCWLACALYEQLELDQFWATRLPDSREGTCWRHILQTLVCYQLNTRRPAWAEIHEMLCSGVQVAPLLPLHPHYKFT